MKHFELQFTEKRVALFTDSTREDLSKYNSDFKVPVLEHKSLAIWDTMSIMEYVSEAFLDNRGWPDNQDARAFARSMSSEMHSSFTCIRNEFPMNCRKHFDSIKPSAAAQEEINRIQSLWHQAKSRFGSGGSWLFGDYSIADAMYAPIALRFHGYNISLDETGKHYVKAVLTHPGIQAWIEAGRKETEIIVEDEIEM